MKCRQSGTFEIDALWFSGTLEAEHKRETLELKWALRNNTISLFGVKLAICCLCIIDDSEGKRTSIRR